MTMTESTRRTIWTLGIGFVGGFATASVLFSLYIIGEEDNLQEEQLQHLDLTDDDEQEVSISSSSELDAPVRTVSSVIREIISAISGPKRAKKNYSLLRRSRRASEIRRRLFLQQSLQQSKHGNSQIPENHSLDADQGGSILSPLSSPPNNQKSFISMLEDVHEANEKSGRSIGSIFGLDIGGTLVKLAYFEPKTQSSFQHTSPTESSTTPPDLHHDQSSAALDEFYQFVAAPSPSNSDDEDDQHQNQIIHSRNSNNQLLDDDGIQENSLSFYSQELGGHFHFLRFETRHMERAMEYIRQHRLHLNVVSIAATGGGAHKYAQACQDMLGIQFQKQNEFDSYVAGSQFALSTVVGECYTFRPQLRLSIEDCRNEDEWCGWSRKEQRDGVLSSCYPYLLVTIGTGVSVIRVDGPGREQHVRVSGSSIGGGTFWGLVRLLADAPDFATALEMADMGDPASVDLMVGDIYGKNKEALDKLGLPANIVASSMAKLGGTMNSTATGSSSNITSSSSTSIPVLEETVQPQDVARAILLMVTNNVAQLAFLNAQLHKTSRILFMGNFLRHNNLAQQRLAYVIDSWSKGDMEALFLEHEGYVGSLGAFLLSQAKYS